MAAGVGGVLSVGGLPEVNIEGVTGFLREPGDVQGMAQGCLDILSSDDAKEASPHVLWPTRPRSK